MAVVKRNRWNPMGLRRDHRGKLLDKWGREMATDWDEFERKRLKPGEPLRSPKVLNPLHQATFPAAEALAAAVIEGESPREFFKRLGVKRPDVGPDWPEWDELDDWHKVAAREFAEAESLGWERDEDSPTIVTDLGYEDHDNASLDVSVGRMSWTIYRDSDVARAVAKERAANDIDEGLFNISWLRHYIDTERLSSSLWSDVENSVSEQFEDEYPGNDDKRDFFIKTGDLDDDDCFTTEKDEDGDEVQVELDVDEGPLADKISELTSEHIEAQVHSMLRDPIEYLTDIFGQEDGIKQAMDIGGIDRDRAAEDAVSENGPEHWLATYDGDVIELNSGAVAYRQT